MRQVYVDIIYVVEEQSQTETLYIDNYEYILLRFEVFTVVHTISTPCHIPEEGILQLYHFLLLLKIMPQRKTVSNKSCRTKRDLQGCPYEICCSEICLFIPSTWDIIRNKSVLPSFVTLQKYGKG
jgi:hypothetical protein